MLDFALGKRDVSPSSDERAVENVEERAHFSLEVAFIQWTQPNAKSFPGFTNNEMDLFFHRCEVLLLTAIRKEVLRFFESIFLPQLDIVGRVVGHQKCRALIEGVRQQTPFVVN